MVKWGSSFVIIVHSWWTSQRSPAELGGVEFVELNSLNSVWCFSCSVFDSCFLPSVACLKHHLIPLLPLSFSFSICLSLTFPHIGLSLHIPMAPFTKDLQSSAKLLLSRFYRAFIIVFIKGQINSLLLSTNL